MLHVVQDETGVGLPTDLRGGEVGASASTSPRVAPETNPQAARRKVRRPASFSGPRRGPGDRRRGNVGGPFVFPRVEGDVGSEEESDGIPVCFPGVNQGGGEGVFDGIEP